MIWVILGCAAYILFFLYDLSGIIHRLRIFHFGFMGGCLLLLFATAGLFYAGLEELSGRLNDCPAAVIIGGAMALLFLILLIYTLFLPCLLQPPICRGIQGRKPTRPFSAVQVFMHFAAIPAFYGWRGFIWHYGSCSVHPGRWRHLCFFSAAGCGIRLFSGPVYIYEAIPRLWGVPPRSALFAA